MADALDMSVGGSQRESGRCGVEKNRFSMPAIHPRPSSTSPITIPTELSENDSFIVFFSALISSSQGYQNITTEIWVYFSTFYMPILFQIPLPANYFIFTLCIYLFVYTSTLSVTQIVGPCRRATRW
jgi:hypothetical protein